MFRRHPALTAVLLLLATIGLYLWSKPAAVASAPAATAPAPAKPAPVVAPAYGTCPPSPDGIGKTWMGREISQVMGHPGIGWLERDNREKEEAPSKAIALLELAPDTVIADIGAGSGYYSFRIAPKIPRGRVVAVDIQPEMLDFLKKESARLGIPNVQPHLGAIDDVKLPPASLDAALMVDASHEFDHPVEMLASLRSALSRRVASTCSSTGRKTRRCRSSRTTSSRRPKPARSSRPPVSVS